VFRATLVHFFDNTVSQYRMKNGYVIQTTCLVAVVIVWSRTLRGEHRLKLFENRVLRRIFGPKRDEVTGEL
jgi:hypothetical protein